MGAIRLPLRIAALAIALLFALLLHGLWRLVRARSPWPRLFLAACAWIVGARVTVTGRTRRRQVVLLANHLSWIDVLLLAGQTGCAFVAKAELARSRPVAWLCGLNHTLFVARDDRLGVAGQIDRLRAALAQDWPVAIFPEGTTGDGRALLPFKAALLGALDPPPPGLLVQPVRVDYGAATVELAWADAETGLHHARRVLSRRGRFEATLRFLDPLDPASVGGRKAIAAEARRRIEAAGEAGGAPVYARAMSAPRPLPKSFHVKSFGCQMNVYDGERMAELMAEQGMVAADAADADLVVLNTCHIREKATEKVFSDIGRLRKHARKADRAAPMIAVAGCVAQAEGAEIVARAGVEVVVGPQAYHQLPALVAEAAGGNAAIDTEMPVLSKFGALPPRRRVGPSAFLTVQEGCDKFCTYCVVPYTRGAEVSRPFAALVDEAKALVDAGAREITLLGQNVNAWSDDEQGLHDLIRALDRLPGLARIRYTTSHPNDMTQGLIDAHRDVGALMPFLHLPVQAGSDRVLRAMNRHHTRDGYLRLLDRIRVARPDIALSGDFIVGFPGETDTEFEETLSLVDAVGYAQAFSFKYSPRPGTPAATLAEQVPADVMDERLQRLQAALGRDQLAFNRASVGRSCQVLVERAGKLPGQVLGKSPWLQSVHLTAGAAIGDLVEVELTSAGPVSLGGVALARLAA